ncbi:MAG: hypothetical protein LLF96_10925 [Eubacteriales bacterium]|nr:hypothetical protein [Eubacteriales bacterium]
MKKKLALALVCLVVALALAGCAAVNEQNSFQSQAPGEVAVTSNAQPAETQAPLTEALPTMQLAEVTATPETAAEPTPTPESVGFNG